MYGYMYCLCTYMGTCTHGTAHLFCNGCFSGDNDGMEVTDDSVLSFGTVLSICNFVTASVSIVSCMLMNKRNGICTVELPYCAWTPTGTMRPKRCPD